jgi:hypothetical protein
MATTINPTFSIVKSTDTTRDYGDSLTNFSNIVDSVNSVLVTVDASFAVFGTITVTDTSLYYRPRDGSLYSWAVTKK